MPGVPFCDLNDAYGSSDWEKAQNSVYINNNFNQTTTLVDEDLQSPKNFLKAEPEKKFNEQIQRQQQPQRVQQQQQQVVQQQPQQQPQQVPNYPTFNNAFSCKNRNNTFQQDVNNNILRSGPNYNMNIGQGSDPVHAYPELNYNEIYDASGIKNFSNQFITESDYLRSMQMKNPINPNFYYNDVPGPYENYNSIGAMGSRGIVENFQNIFSKEKFVDFFKTYDQTDQTLQIVIIMLFVIFFVQLTDIIFN